MFDEILKLIKENIKSGDSVADVTETLTKQLDKFGVELSIFEQEGIDSGNITCSGFFNQYDVHDKYNIELALIVADEDDTLIFQDGELDQFVMQINLTLEHEMTHREQAIKRNGLIIPIEYDANWTDEQKKIVYLSDPDEIDAFSVNLSTEIVEAYGADSGVKALTQYRKIPKELAPTLDEYITTFGSDHDIVRTVVLKAVKRIIH